MILRMLGAILFGGGAFGATAGWLLCKFLDARRAELAQFTGRARRKRRRGLSYQTPAVISPPRTTVWQGGDAVTRRLPSGVTYLVQSCLRPEEHSGHSWETLGVFYWCDGCNADGSEPYPGGER